jgi:hypothetical protein
VAESAVIVGFKEERREESRSGIGRYIGRICLYLNLAGLRVILWGGHIGIPEPTMASSNLYMLNFPTVLHPLCLVYMLLLHRILVQSISRKYFGLHFSQGLENFCEIALKVAIVIDVLLTVGGQQSKVTTQSTSKSKSDSTFRTGFYGKDFLRRVILSIREG